MRIQIGEARRQCPEIGGAIEYVEGSGDDVEIKIVLNDGRAIWLVSSWIRDHALEPFGDFSGTTSGGAPSAMKSRQSSE